MRGSTVSGARRRQFLQWLLASPALAAAAVEFESPDPIAAPADALNVMDFERVARARLPPAHFAYLATGTDGEATLRANREGFERFKIRPRRLVDVRSVDPSITLFGRKWSSPIVLAPVGSMKAFHPEGEVAAARAARSRGHLQVLSTVASSAIEEVNTALGLPAWYQLYPTDDWSVTQALVRRAAAAGCEVLVLTVDLQGGSNRETAERGHRADARDCQGCHVGGFNSPLLLRRKPMFSGADVSRVTQLSPMHATWDIVQRLRDLSPMKLLIKGIVTREDAALAVDRGVDGIVVSNHGGRAEDSGRATIECLPEIIDAVRGRIPVLIDGGFRRGTDIFKALAIGADAVCVGRPYAWGLAGFGQDGVDAVLRILRRELEMTMRQAGTVDRSKITSAYVIQS